MEIEEYMGATEATELKFPNGLKLNDVQITFLSQAAASAHNSGNALDALKKHLVYGKDIGLAVDGELANEVELTSEQAEILHAALGKVTESIEFFDAVINWIAGKEPDRVNLAEEVGDGWWYDMILCRLWNIPPGMIMDANIAKLAARYPEKFNQNDALVRDLGNERGVLQEHLGELISHAIQKRTGSAK
jgi:hypothetical protein